MADARARTLHAINGDAETLGVPQEASCSRSISMDSAELAKII